MPACARGPHTQPTHSPRTRATRHAHTTRPACAHACTRLAAEGTRYGDATPRIFLVWKHLLFCGSPGGPRCAPTVRRVHGIPVPGSHTSRGSRPPWGLRATVLCPTSPMSWRANGPTLPISDVDYEKPITPSGDDGRRRRLAPGGPSVHRRKPGDCRGNPTKKTPPKTPTKNRALASVP